MRKQLFLAAGLALAAAPAIAQPASVGTTSSSSGVLGDDPEPIFPDDPRHPDYSAPVPAPAGVLLLAAGLALLVARQRLGNPRH